MNGRGTAAPAENCRGRGDVGYNCTILWEIGPTEGPEIC
jgi:hypothetical protein